MALFAFFQHFTYVNFMPQLNCGIGHYFGNGLCVVVVVVCRNYLYLI